MKTEQFSKQDYLLLAKLAQQTQRYDEMIEYVDHLLRLESQLNSSQRNLCSSAYKNVVGNRRAELRVLSCLKDKTKPIQPIYQVIQQYQSKIKQQLAMYCHRIIRIIDKDIISIKNHLKSIEAKVFYLKIKADYYRYLCQFNPEQKQYFELANTNYEEADHLARSNLPQTNPVRLALHLNMSIFLWDWKEEQERALILANRTFDEAIANIDTVSEDNYKDCTMILQLIRDNIGLWSGDTG